MARTRYASLPPDRRHRPRCNTWRAWALLAAAAASPAAVADNLELLRLPPGFAIAVYTDRVPDARQMALGSGGVLFVGTREAGKVYAVVDADGDHRAERVYTLASGLLMPSGVALRDGDLYIAEVHQITRLRGIEARLASPPAPEVVYADLPRKLHHGWKYLAFGPDGKLYVPVGAPCNVCETRDPYGTILQMEPDGTNPVVYARGIRNSVGFAWRPGTRELWFTDNGRDLLGDEIPPCELNRATRPGLHFGFPYVHAGDLRDPEFGRGADPADYVSPARKLGPHVAPLGIEFYAASQFPPAYRGLFIAEHGSWNRTRKIGYRVTMVTLDAAGTAVGYEPFATGWQVGQISWGRPVDLEVMPDGSMLVSDDQAGAIYRIWYASDG